MIVQRGLLLLILVGFSVSASAQQQDHGGSGDGQQHGGQMKAAEQAQGGHGQMKGAEGGHGQMSMSRTRHHFARDHGIGESYKGEMSPLAASAVDMGAAKTLYANNCASCHGEKGLGDGAEGVTLDPAPTNIARFAKMGMAKDDYLLWTLSEGGEPVASDMPAFKGVLTRNEIWQLIGYLREL